MGRDSDVPAPRPRKGLDREHPIDPRRSDGEPARRSLLLSAELERSPSSSHPVYAVSKGKFPGATNRISPRGPGSVLPAIEAGDPQMRIGLYLGRHAGEGGGMAVYARELLLGIVRLLEDPANDSIEIVAYGDDTVLTREIEEEIAISPVLSQDMDAWDFRSASSYFRPLPNGARCRVVLCRLSRGGGHRLRMLLDQLFLPLRFGIDRLTVVHSLANVALIAARGVRLATVHDLYQAWPPSAETVGGAERKRLVPSLYRALYRMQFRRLDHVVTDTPSVANEIVGRYGYDRARITSIPLGLDHVVASFAKCPPQPDRFERRSEEIMRATRLEPGYLLYVGGLDPRKNLRRALRAYRDAGSAYTLAIRTGDPVSSVIDEELGADTGSVRLVPWISRDEWPYLLLNAAVLYVPTLAEGYGLPAAEALALGVPVVSGPLEIYGAGSVSHHVCNPSLERSIADALTAAIDEAARAAPAGRGERPRDMPQQTLGLERLRRLREGRARPRTFRDTAADTLALYNSASVRYR